jgi:methylated-DNA-[protein]-cysteine S-methyltransferase
MNSCFRTLRTPRGYVGFVASNRGLRRVYLPTRTADSLKRVIRKDTPGVTEDRQLLPELTDALRRYFAGQPVEFSVKFDWVGRSNFEIDVYHACRRVRYGQTRSYKQLAEQLGRPGAARAVGTAMSRNPCPIVVPCHRVVRSDGLLGGFSGPDGINAKRRLLRMEAAALR